MEYRFADSEESARIHLEAYGQEALDKGQILPVDLGFSFKFECKPGQSPGCCRKRSAVENTVPIQSCTREIVHFCRSVHRDLPGVVHGKTLHLDGLSVGQRVKATVLREDGSQAYKDGQGRDCQFLSSEGLCDIYPVRPLLCRLAPLGFVVDHGRKVIALAFIAALQERCPQCFETETVVTVKDWIVGVFSDRLLRELRDHQVVGGAL